jgi:hypothetical protein
MEWTISNLLIQLSAGILGGHLIAAVTREHRFGTLGHTIVAMIGAGLSGIFLQTIVRTVTASGNMVVPTPQELIFMQGALGAGVGAISVLAVGFVKDEIERQKAPED